MHAGEPEAGCLPQSERQIADVVRRALSRYGPLHQRDCSLAQDAGRLALGIALDHAGGRVGGLPADSGRSQSGAVSPDGVTVVAAEDNRQRRSQVQIAGGRLDTPDVGVPPAPEDPAVGDARGEGANGLDGAGQSFAAGQVYLGESTAVHEDVRVSVDQAGQSHPSAEVDRARSGGNPRGHRIVVADSAKPIAVDRDRRCVRLAGAGPDPRVAKN